MKFQFISYIVSCSYTGKDGEIIREERNFGENKAAADKYKEKILKNPKILYAIITTTEMWHD